MDRLRVLVVEDEGMISLVLMDVLEDLGYEPVGPFALLADAVAAARSEPFDIALVDITLGRDLAYPVADELIRRNIPFAFTTGHNTATLPKPYDQFNALAKPYTAITVQAALVNLSNMQALRPLPDMYS